MPGTPVTLETTLWFGKHDGMTLAWILDNDPEWVIWADANLTGLGFDQDAVQVAKEVTGNV